MMSPQEMVDNWPFPFGNGPFRIKGVAYVGQRKGLDKSWRGGFDGFMTVLESESPELARFLQQPFLASSFYDVFGLAAISHYVSRMSSRPFADMVRRGAGVQMRRDLEGVYSFILNADSPKAALTRVVTVTNQYFDFSPIVVPELEEGSAILSRREFPLLLAAWYGPVAEGYFAASLESAGARGIQAEASIVATGTGPAGLEMGDFQLRATWS